MLLAIRRASSLMSSLAGDRRPAPLAPHELRRLFTGLRSVLRYVSRKRDGILR
jgi:hypothetical protein